MALRGEHRQIQSALRMQQEEVGTWALLALFLLMALLEAVFFHWKNISPLPFDSHIRVCGMEAHFL